MVIHMTLRMKDMGMMLLRDSACLNKGSLCEICASLARGQDLDWATGGASVGGTTKGTAAIVGGQ